MVLDHVVKLVADDDWRVITVVVLQCFDGLALHFGGISYVQAQVLLVLLDKHVTWHDKQNFLALLDVVVCQQQRDEGLALACSQFECLRRLRATREKSCQVHLVYFKRVVTSLSLLKSLGYLSHAFVSLKQGVIGIDLFFYEVCHSVSICFSSALLHRLLHVLAGLGKALS